jgi:bifunctional non-homologous end joining protein LigD
MPLQFQPMPLLKKRLPFDHPDFIFEIKWDGIPSTRCHGAWPHAVNLSKHRFASFADLEKLISAGLPDIRAVIDGEICSLDKKGRPQFRDLLFHRGNYPCFLAFDLLMRDGKDCRRERLLDRKHELQRVLSGSDARIQYVDYGQFGQPIVAHNPTICTDANRLLRLCMTLRNASRANGDFAQSCSAMR